MNYKRTPNEAIRFNYCYIKDHRLCLFLYDFDGVLTDNRVLVSEDGMESVFCNRSDGLAIQKIKRMGIEQIIVSTEANIVVSVRANRLDIPVFFGVQDKKKAVIDYCEKASIELNEVMFIGNDINDLEVMTTVGYSACPNDAYPEIKKIAKLVLPIEGGKGVIRELINYIEIDKKDPFS